MIGADASVDGFWGSGSHGQPVKGAGLTLGPGAGGLGVCWRNGH